MDEGQRSLPEIARRLDEVFTRLEQTVDSMPRTFVSREYFVSREELYKSEHEKLQIQLSEQRKRIEDLEDDKTWLYRLVVGAVILALVGLALGVAGHAVNPSTTKSTGQVSTR